MPSPERNSQVPSQENKITEAWMRMIEAGLFPKYKGLSDEQVAQVRRGETQLSEDLGLIQIY